MQYRVVGLALVITLLIGKRGVFSAEVDLENWMWQLPDELKNFPLIHLAIPGTHNSMSYGISSESVVAPDAPKFMTSKYFDIFLGGQARKWASTQNYDATAQLQAGIRYFDLRVVRGGYDEKYKNTIYFTHGYFANEITNGLRDIKTFLDCHPKEVVILHFQHFYNFDDNLHKILVKKLQDMFGSIMCPYHLNPENVTLSSLHESGKQVIIVYDVYVYNNDLFWKRHIIRTPWPNTDDVDILLNTLKDNLNFRYGNSFYVVQAIITPTTSFVVSHTHQSFETITRNIQDKLIPFLEEKEAGAPGYTVTINIVIMDYVEVDDNRFSKSIINLNYKSLD